MIDVFLSALPGEHATKQLMNIGSTQHLLTPLGLLTPFILTVRSFAHNVQYTLYRVFQTTRRVCIPTKRNTIVDLKEITTVYFTFVSLGRERGIWETLVYPNIGKVSLYILKIVTNKTILLQGVPKCENMFRCYSYFTAFSPVIESKSNLYTRPQNMG